MSDNIFSDRHLTCSGLINNKLQQNSFIDFNKFMNWIVELIHLSLCNSHVIKLLTYVTNYICNMEGHTFFLHYYTKMFVSIDYRVLINNLKKDILFVSQTSVIAHWLNLEASNKYLVKKNWKNSSLPTKTTPHMVYCTKDFLQLFLSLYTVSVSGAMRV